MSVGSPPKGPSSHQATRQRLEGHHEATVTSVQKTTRDFSLRAEYVRKLKIAVKTYKWIEDIYILYIYIIYIPESDETNSEFTPENGWLEDYFSFGMAYFQGLY